MIERILNITNKSIFIQNKALIKNIYDAGFYLLGPILQFVLSLIAQPIYSKYLSASEFGIIGYFGSLNRFFTPIFIFGMTSVYLMKYFRQKENDNKKLLFNLVFYLFCLNTITAIIGYYSIYRYFNYFHVNIPLNPFAWFILITLLLNNIKSAVLINLRIRKKALSFFAFSSLNSILNFIIGILFVAYYKWGAEGRMLAPIISTIVMLPLCLYILRSYITVNFKINTFLKAVKSAFPLVLAAYSYIPIVSIDVIFLERLNNLSELGLYNIGISIAGYSQLAFAALMNAFEPDIFKSVAELKINRLIIIALIMYLPMLIFILIFMNFSKTFVSILTAGRYIAAYEYTNITLLSIFLLCIFSFFDKIFIAMGKTKMNFYINAVSGVIAIIIIYFGAYNYAYIGAAWGKVIVALIMVIISLVLVVKYLKKGKVEQLIRITS